MNVIKIAMLVAVQATLITGAAMAQMPAPAGTARNVITFDLGGLANNGTKCETTDLTVSTLPPGCQRVIPEPARSYEGNIRIVATVRRCTTQPGNIVTNEISSVTIRATSGARNEQTLVRLDNLLRGNYNDLIRTCFGVENVNTTVNPPRVP